MDGYTGSILLDIAAVCLGLFIFLRWGNQLPDWIEMFWDWISDGMFRLMDWLVDVTGVGRFVDWLMKGSE